MDRLIPIFFTFFWIGFGLWLIFNGLKGISNNDGSPLGILLVIGVGVFLLYIVKKEKEIDFK